MRKSKPSKKTIEKYYIERETLLTPAEAKKSGELPSKIEKITLSKKEAECFKNETLKTFLESKKQELKTFLESPGYDCSINPPSGNNCPEGKKGKYVISLKSGKTPEVIFRPDDFKHKGLIRIYLHQLNDIQALLDAGNHEKAVILAFSIGEDIQRLFRMDHVSAAGIKYKSDNSRAKTSQIKRLEKSEENREYYLDLWQKMKAKNPKPSARKINDTFYKHIAGTSTEIHRNTLLKWRKNAGL
jgi:hypothetical protein